jgi:glycolate oxidase FAD binding subunit
MISLPSQLRPANKLELAEALRAANQASRHIGHVDLNALRQIKQHTPEDLTVTVEAGLTLAELQSALAQRGQWLPIDPPNAHRLTIAALLAANVSGPRRFGFGTIRDHLIGLEVILADGRLIHSGGKVVKNVAGYDLMKLFIGAKDSLGIIVEATFKLLPLPETESILHQRCETLEAAGRLLEAIHESPVTPTIIDLHRIDTDGAWHVVVAFAGTREEVTWQLAEAARLGMEESGTLDYEKAFWTEDAGETIHRSVLPSRLIETIGQLGDVPLVARAGNGVIYHQGETAPPSPALPTALLDRVKETFDPNRILP